MTVKLGQMTMLTALAMLPAVFNAHADAIVTACATDTQMGAGVNLAQALAAGGIIRFSCPPNSSIRVTGRYRLTNSTSIDGGGQITLDGHGLTGPMLATEENIILRHITLRGFVLPPVPRVQPGTLGLGRLNGSVLHASGDAELDLTTVEASESPIDISGKGWIHDSSFSHNPSGYAVNAGGSLNIKHSRFVGNSAAVLMNAGTIEDCQFINQSGNAVRIGPPLGPVRIAHSMFTGTRDGAALSLSQRAGRNGAQTINLRSNVFRDNDAGPQFGTVSLFDVVQEARDMGQAPVIVRALEALPPTTFVSAYNEFTGNHGGSGAALSANLAYSGGMTSTGDLFIQNTASGVGGAIALSGGTLQISHAVFTSNSAAGTGAAIAVAPDGKAIISNVLVAKNVGPTGTISGNEVTLINVTVADNRASGLQGLDVRARIANTILSHNVPSDCAVAATASFQGPNLQSDGSCGTMPIGEAYLDDFYIPATGSPALHGGDVALCRASPVGGFDLAFQARATVSNCALGAFEQSPIRKFDFPTDRREVHALPTQDFSDSEGYRPPAIWTTHIESY